MDQQWCLPAACTGAEIVRSTVYRNILLRINEDSFLELLALLCRVYCLNHVMVFLRSDWTVPMTYHMEMETSSIFSRHFQCRMRHQDMGFTRSNVVSWDKSQSVNWPLDCKLAFRLSLHCFLNPIEAQPYAKLTFDSDQHVQMIRGQKSEMGICNFLLLSRWGGHSLTWIGRHRFWHFCDV